VCYSQVTIFMCMHKQEYDATLRLSANNERYGRINHDEYRPFNNNNNDNTIFYSQITRT
jgi:hypothetical protein